MLSSHFNLFSLRNLMVTWLLTPPPHFHKILSNMRQLLLSLVWNWTRGPMVNKILRQYNWVTYISSGDQPSCVPQFQLQDEPRWQHIRTGHSWNLQMLDVNRLTEEYILKRPKKATYDNLEVTGSLTTLAYLAHAGPNLKERISSKQNTLLHTEGS